MPRSPLGLAVPLWLVILVACSSAAFAGQENPTAAALAEERQAADQGHAAAQYNLGVMYANGEGVPQDYVEAHKWRNLAASRVGGDTQKEYAEVRDLLAKQMTPTQLAEAQRLAREWQAAFEKRQTD